MSRHSLKTYRWAQVCEIVKRRDGYRCVACGARDDLTVDHIKPISKLGPDELAAGVQYDPDRCLTLCRPCNASKGDREHLRVTWVNPRWRAQFSEAGLSSGSAQPEPFSHNGDPEKTGGMIL